ncbi:hypothetical protein ACJMK2_034674 [Sinanodonta woodiana]|uniref:DUF7802 domain-containing protein n=1 Tax=Sinanodonta woodiana TaxID=1069815 RepID=A0ABD3WVU5_SINWO
MGSTLRWWVTFRDPRETYRLHDSFLKCELVFLTGCVLTLIHALRSGGRFRWLWLSVVLHGLWVEAISYNLPDVDNFWHAQGTVMFLGQRLPFYVVALYPLFLYTASVAVAHTGLPWWTQPFAVGLSVVLLDVPYDIMGIKNLWWTWHDTDPNIFDRHYHVPWTSYYFHASFAAGFTFVFHGLHRLLASDKKTTQNIGIFKELICCLVASMCGFPLGVLQFIPVYHTLHDIFHIHSEVCVFILFAVYAMIIWTAFQSVARGMSATPKRKFRLDEILTLVILHYTFYIYLVFTAKPQNVVAVGLHEPVGSCNETTPVTTPFGHVLSKNKYLCLEEYDEPVFDFHCVKSPPPPGSEWYTICGTKFPNHAEYIVVVCAFCVFGLAWYLNLLLNMGSLPSTKPTHTKPKQN